MTIQDWGSIGELIAAVATVATLVYLAVQIRANTTALRVEARRAESRSGNVFLGAIVASPDVARMFNEGLADPRSLSPEDVTRFIFLLGNLVGAEAGAFDEAHIGFAPESSLGRSRTTLRRFLLSPGGRWFWERFGADYHAEFRSFVDQVLRDGESAA